MESRSKAFQLHLPDRFLIRLLQFCLCNLISIGKLGLTVNNATLLVIVQLPKPFPMQRKLACHCNNAIQILTQKTEKDGKLAS